ncbi:hypothetical protein D3C77_465330 [compost metagenome]
MMDMKDQILLWNHVATKLLDVRHVTMEQGKRCILSGARQRIYVRDKLDFIVVLLFKCKLINIQYMPIILVV